jgi:hypothetical protein
MFTFVSKRGWRVTFSEGNISENIYDQIQLLNDVYRIIKSVDADALISVAHVMGVFGKGFDVIKISMKKKTLL